MNHAHGGDDPLLRGGEVFSHYKPVKGQDNSAPLQEIELQLISSKNSRVLFYNNNNNGCHFAGGQINQGQQGQHPAVKYHLEDAFLPENGDGDYSECAEFDLTRCCCEGGGGQCAGECGGGVTSGGGSSDPETFYESVLLPGGRAQAGVGSGSGGNLVTRNQFELQTHGRDSNSGNSGKLQSFRNQLRDQVRQDGINFSRIPDEIALRAVAAKYAMDFGSSSAGTNNGPTSIYNGGGASFSSTSTASSSSSGYPSSIASQTTTTNKPALTKSSSASSSSSSGAAVGTMTAGGGGPPPSTTWLREGLPLLEFQQQVLQQLREIWLEERRKLAQNGGHLLLGGSCRSNVRQGGGNSGVNPSCLSFTGRAGSARDILFGGESCRRKLGESSGWDTPRRSGAGRSSGGGAGGGQLYTPGVYQPSSCLRDRDDIYDYVPPRRKPPPDAEDDDDERNNDSPVAQCSTRLGGAPHSHFDRRDRSSSGGVYSSGGRDCTFVSPRHREATTPTTGGRFSTSRGRNSSSAVNSNSSTSSPHVNQGPPQTPLSYYTISGSCSSSTTNSAHSGSNSQYGIVSGFPHYQHTRGSTGDETVGCKTLVNLHKLGRRLGLTRFFRTLRLQNADGSTTETTTRHYFNSPTTSSDRVLYAITPTSAETLARLRRLQPQTNHNSGFQADDVNPGEGQFHLERIIGSSISNEPNIMYQERDQESGGGCNDSAQFLSLPVNQHMETINRLKYEYEQRNRKRDDSSSAKEHQAPRYEDVDVISVDLNYMQDQEQNSTRFSTENKKDKKTNSVSSLVRNFITVVL